MSEGHYRYNAMPAAEIIRRCGGVRAVAQHLRVTPEAVSKCNRPREHGGTGGSMPAAWHRKMALLGEQFGMRRRDVMLKLRIAGEKKITEEEFMNRAKDKGDRFEREVVYDLRAAGFKTHRVPLSGAVEGYKGDVIAESPETGKWVIQCKVNANRARSAGVAASHSQGRAGIVRLLQQVDFGIVEVADGTTYVAMRQKVFENLLRGIPPAAVNVPRVQLKSGLLIAQAIEGHDALVFRRDRAREWMAVTREEK